MNQQPSIPPQTDQSAPRTLPLHFKVITWIIAIFYLLAGIILVSSAILGGITTLLKSPTPLGILKTLGAIVPSIVIFGLAWGMRKRLLWALYAHTILLILLLIIIIGAYIIFLGMNLQNALLSILFNSSVGIIVLIYLWLNRKWFT